MIELTVMLVLAFAAYRLTRLFVIDAILEEPRMAVENWLINKEKWIWAKFHYLMTCTFCTGIWVSAALYGAYTAAWPWQYGRLGWISVAAIAGTQALLHAFEPSDA